MNFLTMIIISLFVFIVKFIVYPSKYMDDWETFNETLLPEKEDFYSHLNMEVLLIQIKRMQKEFMKILK